MSGNVGASKIAPQKILVRTMSSHNNTSDTQSLTAPDNSPQAQNIELDLFQDLESDENGNTEDVTNDYENLFADLPSNDATRSFHTASRQSFRRRHSAKVRTTDGTINPEDVASLVDVEDGPKNIAKSYPAPMAQRKSVRQIQAQRKSQKGTQKSLSVWKNLKLRIAMAFHLFSVRIKDFFVSLQLWRGSLKEVEGKFGNGVLSYFIFLKSLFILNILIFLTLFCFLVVPQIVVDYGHLVNLNTSDNDPQCPAVNKRFYVNRSSVEHILDFFTGQGYINTTLMFYSNYHGRIVVNDDGLRYDMPLAYLLVGGSYIILSLLVMVKNLAAGFTESIIDSGGFFYSYCNKVFAGWDYCITNEKNVLLKCSCIYKDFVAELAEEERLERIKGRTRVDKFKIYVLRFFVTLLVMGLLAASIYAIIKSVEVSTDPSLTQQNNSFIVILQRWASSLTISVLNVILPLIFELLTSLEDWSPRVEVAMALWRAVLLKLASVAVLVIVLFSTYSEHSCVQCWENLVGGQMFNLIFIDFIVVVGITVIVETGRKFSYMYLNCGCKLGQKIGLQEFQIAKNVLDLVYGQSLIWIGSFFAPLLPVLGIIKLFILFYVKKISLMYNCKPSLQAYQGARSNYFFTLLLLLTFLLCTVAVGWGVTKIPTSHCGPFCNKDCKRDKEMIDIISKTLDTWPTWIQDVIDFLKTSVFIFPLTVIIFLLLYYYHAMTKACEKMIGMLKDQLVMEGRDKRFLMDRIVKATELKKQAQRMNTPVTTLPEVE